ncbi:MAG: PQQ-dependent sugar dehydrogenase [Oligoflexus sp.]
MGAKIVRFPIGLITAIVLFAAPVLAQTLEKVFQDKGVIWSLAFPPDGRILYTLRSGELKVYDPRTQSATLITGTPQVFAKGQGGLLEVALAPDFATSKTIYLTYAKDLGERQSTALARANWEGTELKNLRELFVAKPGTKEGVHYAGKLVFDKDSILLTVGDRGERDLAQKLDNHMGKVLRLTLDGQPYPDNPFTKTKGALPEIYSYGHRNPQGATLHPKTGELWVHEHGPRGGDEINRVTAGKNYGWPVITYGKEYWGPNIGEGTKKSGMEQPVHYYVPSIAPSGLMIYNGDRYPEWKNQFLIGSLVQTHLNVVAIEETSFKSETRFFADQSPRIRDVRVSPDDWIYLATDQGIVYRVLPALKK